MGVCAVNAVSFFIFLIIDSCQNFKHKWTVRWTRETSRIFYYLEHNTQDHKQQSSTRDTPVDPLIYFLITGQQATESPRDVTKTFLLK